MEPVSRTPLEFRNPCVTAAYIITSPLVGLARIIYNIAVGTVFLVASCGETTNLREAKKCGFEILKGFSEIIFPIIAGVIYFYRFCCKQESKKANIEREDKSEKEAIENAQANLIENNPKKLSQEQTLIDFLEGNVALEVTYRGKKSKQKIDQILNWKNEDLENGHDWVQFLFPTRRPSDYNNKAIVLTESLIAKIKNSKTALKNIEKAFNHYLKFLGIDIQTLENGETFLTSYESENGRWPVWTLDDNHNMKRITRVLECLSIFFPEIDGKRDLLQTYLGKVIHEAAIQTGSFNFGIITPFRYWRKFFNKEIEEEQQAQFQRASDRYPKIKIPVHNLFKSEVLN